MNAEEIAEKIKKMLKMIENQKIDESEKKQKYERIYQYIVLMYRKM